MTESNNRDRESNSESDNRFGKKKILGFGLLVVIAAAAGAAYWWLFE